MRKLSSNEHPASVCAMPLVKMKLAAPFGFVAAAVSTLLACQPLAGQVLRGVTGLIEIPTAEIPADGDLTIGLHLLDARYHDLIGEGYQGHPALVQSASIAFLPFLEVGLRLSRSPEEEGQALGDRAGSARLRVLSERAYTPAVAIGGRDLVGTRMQHALYVVASKSLPLQLVPGEISLHAGMWGNWLGLNRSDRGPEGFFGGITVRPVEPLTLMIEYDSEDVNAGARLRVWRFTALGALQNLEGLSGGLSYTHPLK